MHSSPTETTRLTIERSQFLDDSGALTAAGSVFASGQSCRADEHLT
jgi:hypothetical protein